MKQKIEEFFLTNGFKKLGEFEDNSSIIKLLLKTGFHNIFISPNENEVYIVETNKHVFREEELKSFETKIIGLVGFLPNIPLRYNINMVLACPLNIRNNGKSSRTKNQIIRYERIKYYCRRFFLDTANLSFEDELAILPFSSIQLDINVKGYEGIVQEIKKILPEEIFTELVREQTDYSRLKEIMSSIQ